MKTKLLPLAGVALAMAMTVTSAFAEDKKEEKKPEFGDLTVEQLQAAIKDGKVAIIDANGAPSYNKAHIPGAVHFPTLKKKGLKKALPEDKAALVVAYCGGPKCAAWSKAAAAAQGLGYTNVKHLSAGISGWKKAKGATEIGDVKAPEKKVKKDKKPKAEKKPKKEKKDKAPA